MSWNFGDLLDGIDEIFPADAPAVIHGDRTLPWGDFARRSNRLADALVQRGARPGDKVAFYMRNCPEYVELLAACFKARLVHVNVNFRYRDEELWYILDNSDARFVFFGAEFAERSSALRWRLPMVEGWIQIGGDADSFADPYEPLASEGAGSPLDIRRSGDDLIFLYTGGTTGMPKGVMWRSEDLWGALGYGATSPPNGGVVPESPTIHLQNVKNFGPRVKQIVCCPLMHGTGLLTAIGTIVGGGAVVPLPSAGFDPVELWDTVERQSADSLVIVGDAFGRPMLNALDEKPGRWDLRSLKLIVSSGVIWSKEVKQGLLRHHSGMVLYDTFGSSEAVGFGSSSTTATDGIRTAKFQIGDHCKVFSEDHREVVPGSGERGFIARRGPIPLGYYKDSEKSSRTFPVIDGVRYSIPGDWCTVEADGTLTLLGRGSVCINTAGEKVYPEEVEEALKTHPEVDDALVVGLEDAKWGQAVTGVVQVRRGASPEEDELRRHVRAQLAGYKTPKRIVQIDTVPRAPNGKADYKAAAAYATSELSRE